MKTRNVIGYDIRDAIQDGDKQAVEHLTFEVLLDIREILLMNDKQITELREALEKHQADATRVLNELSTGTHKFD